MNRCRPPADVAHTLRPTWPELVLTRPEHSADSPLPMLAGARVSETVVLGVPDERAICGRS